MMAYSSMGERRGSNAKVPGSSPGGPTWMNSSTVERWLVKPAAESSNLSSSAEFVSATKMER